MVSSTFNEPRRVVSAADLAIQQQFQVYMAARQASAKPATDGYGDFGMSCARCGGTPSGRSVRGFVGRCSCGGAS